LAPAWRPLGIGQPNSPIRVATNTALKPIVTGRAPDAIAIFP
jgi:hypothetical protein